MIRLKRLIFNTSSKCRHTLSTNRQQLGVLIDRMKRVMTKRSVIRMAVITRRKAGEGFLPGPLHVGLRLTLISFCRFRKFG